MNKTLTISTVLFMLLTVTLLAGCGTAASFRDLKQKGDTIYVKGTLETIQTAAISALEDRRLTSPSFEPIPGGVEIYAEQSVVAGMVYNSYGGYGKVTVALTESLGLGIYAVSAFTRSRAAYEPVGSQDSLKENNYNNPLLARQILERIKELVNAKAPG